MSELLTGITPQPNFPREDLTEDNASMLELTMANREILELQHEQSEALITSFYFGHKALSHSSAKIFDNDQSLAALNHGITVFEAIASSVLAGLMRSDIRVIFHRTTELLQLEKRQVSDYLDEAAEDFSKSAPRTAEVVIASSSRFHKHLTTYALIGAASSWRLEQSIP